MGGELAKQHHCDFKANFCGIWIKQTFVGFGPGCDEVKLNRIAISYGIYFFGKMELIKNRVLKQFFVGFNFFISPKRICPQI